MKKTKKNPSVRRLSTARARRSSAGSETALLIVDMMNEFDFPGGEKLARRAERAARNIVKLKAEMKRRKNPVIYANDNFGRWNSDAGEVVRRCLSDKCRGSTIARMLAPDREDYFVLKPKHSAFFSTTLETLLSHLKVRRLVITGIAGNLCVFHTALDAHVRDFSIAVPRDAIACENPRDESWTTRQIAHYLAGDTRPARDWYSSG